MSTDEGFWSRWSRRKAQARAGVVAEDDAPTTSAVGLSGSGVWQPPPTPAHTLQDADATESAPDSDMRATAPPEQAPPNPPLPTLEDVQRLTPESDFRPFLRPQVAPEVRNAALRKLFADPRFNVMDGLDIYIDDYSQPNPLPGDIARRLLAAHAERVFEEAPPAAKPAAVSEQTSDAKSDSARTHECPVDADNANGTLPEGGDDGALKTPPAACASPTLATPPMAAVRTDVISASDSVS